MNREFQFKIKSRNTSKVICVVLSTLIAYGQPLLHAQDLFKKYLTDSTLTDFTEIESQLSDISQNSPGSLSILDRIEFRTQTNNFRLDQQQYSFRLGFHSWQQNRLKNRIDKSNVALLDNRINEIKSQALFSKYLDIIDFIFLTQSLMVDQRKRSSLEKIMNVSKEKIPQLKNPILSVAKLEIQLSEVERNILRYENGIRKLSTYMALNPNGRSSDDLSLPEPKSILDFISHSSAFLDSSSYETKVLRAENKYLLKRSDDKKILDFVQFRYNSDPNDLFREKASVGLGFKIPYELISNNRKQDLRIELMELQVAYKAEEQVYSLEVGRIKDELLQQIRDIEHIESNFKIIQTKYDFLNLTPLLNEDPEQLMDIQIELFKMEEEYLNKSHDLYVKYVKYLFKSGTLYQQPELYYLKFPLQKL